MSTDDNVILYWELYFAVAWWGQLRYLSITAMREDDPNGERRRPNYEFGLQLYLSNMPLKLIAARLNVSEVALRKAASRKKWAEQRRKAFDVMAADTRALTLTQQGEIFRETVAADLLESAADLASLPRKRTVGGLRSRQQAVNEVILGAEKLFAWPTAATPAGVLTVEHMTQLQVAIVPAGEAPVLEALPLEDEPTTTASRP